jgi:hypothetical protein
VEIVKRKSEKLLKGYNSKVSVFFRAWLRFSPSDLNKTESKDLAAIVSF